MHKAFYANRSACTARDSLHVQLALTQVANYKFGNNQTSPPDLACKRPTYARSRYLYISSPLSKLGFRTLLGVSELKDCYFFKSYYRVGKISTPFSKLCS